MYCGIIFMAIKHISTQILITVKKEKKQKSHYTFENIYMYIFIFI